MRFNVTLAGLLLAVSTPLAAATVRGAIVAKEIGGPGVAKIKVTGIECAKPVLSFDDGTFVLNFPKRQPGEKVRLIVDEPGMVIVNFRDLWFTLLKEPSAEPLILVLCRKDEREEMARRFYQVGKNDTIEQSYRRKVKELQDNHQATEAAMERLRIERDQAREAEKRALEKLERATAEEVSSFYAHPAPTVYRSDAAMGLNTLGIWYRRQNRLEEARKSYDKALEISRTLAEQSPGTYLPDVEETLNNIGNLLSDQNRMQEAEKVYDEALDISRKLAEKDPTTFQPSIASTLNSLGILLRKQNRLEEALEDFKEALKWYRGLTKLSSDPMTYLPRVAETLRNLGILSHDQNRLEEAQKHFIGAFEIYSNLAREKPVQYEPEIQSTYGEALDISLKLAQQNPDIYQPYVAVLQKNLGALYRDQDRKEEAREYFAQALAVYEELAKRNRDRNLNKNALIYFKEAQAIYISFGIENPKQYAKEIESTYVEMLDVSRKLAQEKIEVNGREETRQDYYLPEVAMILRDLGVLKRDQGRKDEARKNLSEALVNYETLASGKKAELYRQDVDLTKRLLDSLTN